MNQGVCRICYPHQFRDDPGDWADQVLVLLNCLLGGEGAVSTIAGEVFLTRFQDDGGQASLLKEGWVATDRALGATGQGVRLEGEVAVIEGK
jgi:hypothetical protein